MTIIYRSEKGSPLTSDEIDNNFRRLEGRLTHLEETTEATEGLENIQLKGDQLTFTGTLGTMLGTFTLPKTTSPPSLVVYEKTSLPENAPLGQLALINDEDNTTLIFFNGTHWFPLMKGNTL